MFVVPYIKLLLSTCMRPGQHTVRQAAATFTTATVAVAVAVLVASCCRTPHTSDCWDCELWTATPSATVSGQEEAAYLLT